MAAPEHSRELSVGNFLRVEANENRLCVITDALVGRVWCSSTGVADHGFRHTRDLGVLLVGSPKSANSKHDGALFIIRLENLYLGADWGVTHFAAPFYFASLATMKRKKKKEFTWCLSLFFVVVVVTVLCLDRVKKNTEEKKSFLCIFFPSSSESPVAS